MNLFGINSYKKRGDLIIEVSLRRGVTVLVLCGHLLIFLGYMNFHLILAHVS